MLKVLSLLFITELLFLGCSVKQNSVKTELGPYSGTFMVHSEDDFPVSLFLDNKKDCIYKGYVKKYDNMTERFTIKINKQVCQDGTIKDVDGYVADATDGMPDVKSLMIGTKVEVFIVNRSSGN